MRKLREEKKYIIKTKEDVRRQKMMVYSILIFLLVILSLLCYRSFSVSAATIAMPEKKTKNDIKTLSMEENINKLNIEKILNKNHLKRKV